MEGEDREIKEQDKSKRRSRSRSNDKKKQAKLPRSNSAPSLEGHIEASKLLVRNPTLMIACIEAAKADGQDELYGRALGACFASESSLLLPYYAILVEVDAAAEPEMVLRGSEICTCAVSEFLIIFGHEYLKNTLGPHIQRVIGSTPEKSLEIERIRILKEIGNDEAKAQTILDKNVTHLIEFIDDMMKDLNSTVPKIPPEIISVIGYIYDALFPKYGDVALKCIRILIFLRYINPIIMFPDQHGLVPLEEVNPQVRRNLQTIAKVIQGGASGATAKFDDKKGGLDRVVEAANRYHEEMKTFIKKILEIYKTLDVLPRKPCEIPATQMAPRLEDLSQFMKLYRKDLHRHAQKIIQAGQNDVDDKNLIKAINDSAQARGMTPPPLMPIERAKFYLNWDKVQILEEARMSSSPQSKSNDHTMREVVLLRAIRREDKKEKTITIPFWQLNPSRVRREIRMELGKFESIKFLDEGKNKKVNLNNKSFTDFLCSGKVHPKKEIQIFTVYVYRKESKNIQKFKDKL